MHNDTPHPVILWFTRHLGKPGGPLKSVPSQREREGFTGDSLPWGTGGWGQGSTSPSLPTCPSLPLSSPVQRAEGQAASGKLWLCPPDVPQNSVPLESLESGVHKEGPGGA